MFHVVGCYCFHTFNKWSGGWHGCLHGRQWMLLLPHLQQVVRGWHGYLHGRQWMLLLPRLQQLVRGLAWLPPWPAVDVIASTPSTNGQGAGMVASMTGSGCYCFHAFNNWSGGWHGYLHGRQWMLLLPHLQQLVRGLAGLPPWPAVDVIASTPSTIGQGAGMVTSMADSGCYCFHTFNKWSGGWQGCLHGRQLMLLLPHLQQVVRGLAWLPPWPAVDVIASTPSTSSQGAGRVASMAGSGCYCFHTYNKWSGGWQGCLHGRQWMLLLPHLQQVVRGLAGLPPWPAVDVIASTPSTSGQGAGMVASMAGSGCYCFHTYNKWSGAGRVASMAGSGCYCFHTFNK